MYGERRKTAAEADGTVMADAVRPANARCQQESGAENGKVVTARLRGVARGTLGADWGSCPRTQRSQNSLTKIFVTITTTKVTVIYSVPNEPKLAKSNNFCYFD